MGGRQVTAPDGTRWRVRRRWLDRPLPDLRKRFSEYREENTGDGMLDGFWFIDAGDSPWVGIALAVGVILLVFLLLPLIGVAIELILLVLLLGSGLVGRVVLRRPGRSKRRTSTPTSVRLPTRSRAGSAPAAPRRRSPPQSNSPAHPTASPKA
jgi:hypothetical protein